MEDTYETVRISAHSEAQDKRTAFSGTIHLSSGNLYGGKRMVRVFGFEVKNYSSQHNATVTFRESDQIIFEIENISLERSFHHKFEEGPWLTFSKAQREMIRLLILGTCHGVFCHFDFTSDSTKMLNGTPCEEIFAVKF